MSGKREDGYGGGRRGKSSCKPSSSCTAPQLFSSAPPSLGPGEVPNLMVKPAAHQVAHCAWPQRRTGTSSITSGSQPLALTLFFEPITFHASLPPSIVSCSPGKCKKETEQSEASPSLPTSIPKKTTCYFISHSLLKLLPRALSVKPEDSSQPPPVRGREEWELWPGRT